ncbi:MAG: hypothetical protein ABIW82_16045, partial [Dokdonella sp.]
MSPSDPVPGGVFRLFSRSILRSKLFVALCVLVAAIRLYQCALLPIETGDVVRNLIYGVLVTHYGFSASTEALTHFSSAWSDVSWAAFPYSYPPVALAFFALVATVSPTVFAVKLALTALEALNAAAIARLCRSRSLGLLYWASPMSIWWVSREGQFEPLQASLTLLSLLTLASFPFVSGAALALAISSKITAGVIVPVFAYRLLQMKPAHRSLAALGLVAGFLPALFAEISYHGMSNVLHYGSLLTYNPYYWNPFADMFAWNPAWLITVNELASYAMLSALVF